MTRDLTQKQFDKKLTQYGMKKQPFMGYVDIGNNIHVSRWNAGDNRRAQLAYLIKVQQQRGA